MATSQPHFASASLYVGDLDPEVNETMLFELFNTIGPVASIRVCRETGTRKSLGYAYVNYHSVSDAERSLDTLNYTPIKGVPCRIMWSHRDPSLRRSGAGNIFVKNLDKMIDNKALYDTFSLFGNILSCKVATDEFGKSKGYGFVHYESEESGQAAIDKVNNMQIGSKTVYVGPFKRRVERQDHVDKNSVVFTNLYVKQFPAEWTEDTLRSIFEPFGEITSLALTTDSMNRRFAFVNFTSPDSAKAAIGALHGKRTTLTGVVTEDADVEDEGSVAAGDVATSSSTTASRAQPGVAEKEKKTQDGETAVDKDMATKPNTSITQIEPESQSQTKEATSDKKTKKIQLQKTDEDDTKTTTAAPSTVAGNEKDSKIGSNVERQSKEEEAPPKAAAPDENTSTTSEHKKDIRSADLTATNITNRLYVQRAMTKAERQSLLRETFSVASDKNQKQQTGVNLYVKNLDDQVTDDMLREAFSKFGTVTSAKVMLDSSGVSRGFGFVCFAFPEEATKALTAMHLKLFQGKPLYVGLAEKRDHRVARLQQRYRLSNASRGVAGATSNVLPAQATASTGLSTGSVPPASTGGPLMTPHQSYYPGNHYYPGNAVRGVNHHPLQQHYGVGAAGPGAWRQQGGVPGTGGPLGARQYYGVASGGATGVVAPPPPGAMLQQIPAGAGPEGTPAYPLMGSAVPPANMISGAMRGAAASGHHQHLGPSHHHRSRNAPGGAAGGMQGAAGGMQGAGSGQQNFKFTSQARNNRQDFITGPMATVTTSGGIPYQQSPQGTTAAGGYIQQAPSAHMLMGGVSAGTGPALDVTAASAMLGPGGLSEMPLSAQTLATAHPQMQKQILGEKLFPLVYKHQPELAGKITGMMLEMDNAELLSLLESDALLQAKVDEALGVLRRHHHQAAVSTRPLVSGPSAPSSTRPMTATAAMPQASSRPLKPTVGTNAVADSNATNTSVSTAPTSGETTATPAGAPVTNGN